MNKNVSFSIIMPFYKSEEYIERAILSVVNQTYNNWELIAVDDGSIDGSFNIVQNYANNDKRIRVIKKDNGGYSTAINCGLDNLSLDSDYFLLLGSDDELFPQILSNLNQFLQNDPIDLVGFGTTCIYDDGHQEHDVFSHVGSDAIKTNTNIIEFYNIFSDIPQLFIGRDTSRVYKTSLLGQLRYFGKYGISADGIFSMLFSYKCSSFAHLAVDGYKWYLRSDSVSAVKQTNLKMEDEFLNWYYFFETIITNNYELIGKAKKYIEYFVRSCLRVISINDLCIYKRNKNKLSNSKKMILKMTKKYKISISYKNRIKLTFPFLYRFFRYKNHS